MRIKILLMAVVLAGLLFSLSASAEIITPACGEVALRQLNFGTTTSFDKFDPSLGNLNTVTLDTQACAQGSRILTNLDQNPLGVDYTVILTATLTANIPGIGPQVYPISVTEDFHLGPGESHTITIGPKCLPKLFVLTDPAQLALYIGAGQQVQVPVNTVSGINVNGSTEWSSSGSTFMSYEICPEYEYQPPMCINGTKINDCTGEGIPGWEICLTMTDSPEVCTTTDANGDYSFCGLMPGDYQVCEETRDGWTPMDATCRDVTLDEVSEESVDFHNEPLFCISGIKTDSCTGLGIAGWTITLTKPDQTTLTTTTDASGNYEFCDLPDGIYTVTEETKAGYTPVGDTTQSVTLECANVTNVDFENTQVHCISGTKTDSCTGLGIAGWTITLTKPDQTTLTTTTDASGNYEFCDLPDGIYTVTEETKAGYTPVGDTTQSVTLECANVTNVDFENTPVHCISGTKTDSCTGLGIAGWTITLTKPDQTTLTTTTDASGNYEFCDLPDGIYTVTEETKAGYTPVGDTTQSVTLECADADGVDFENTPAHCISGTKIDDSTGLGIAGWTIALTKPDQTTLTTTTDASGNYEFCDLPDGTYTVTEVMQSGWSAVGATTQSVTLECADVDGVDFLNIPQTECETAWAKIEPSTCFPGTGNWGWYTKIPAGTMPYADDGDIWAGAAKCDTSKGTLVGTADVTLTANEFHVTSDLLDSCEAKDLHVWVGYVPPSGPVGKYPYKTADVKFKTPLDTSKNIYIAVHYGDMCCSKCFYEGTCMTG